MQAQGYTKGRYAGTNTAGLAIEGLLLSQTIYQKDTESDWHYHEHPYFAFILHGGSIEERRDGSLECLPGHAYFYNWDDVHRNKSYQEGSRNFNLAFDPAWLGSLGIDLQKTKGIMLLTNPDQRLLLTRLFKEYIRQDSSSPLAIQTLSLELIAFDDTQNRHAQIPSWAIKVREILNDRWTENISLKELSETLDIHPVHISRYFPKYIGCSFGEYIRKIRIARSLPLVRSTTQSLTSIAYECGFADQSHFNRTFRRLTHFSPGAFRRL